jgi:aminopeptidase YwaD
MVHLFGNGGGAVGEIGDLGFAGWREKEKSGHGVPCPYGKRPFRVGNEGRIAARGMLSSEVRVRRRLYAVGMTIIVWGGVYAGVARAQNVPLLPEGDVAALANELSGETAKRNLEVIATFHRQRGSRGFHSAAALVAERAREYGLSDVQILEFPADGKIFYGTQRSRPGWDAEKGELWAVVPDVITCGEAAGKKPVSEAEESKKHPGVGVACDALVNKEIKLLASYAAEPVVLAEDSESADVTAELVDVGTGTSEADYAGKDVKGKIVLVSASPGAVQELAVGKFGAAGLVSYAQNQKNAWWGEDENLIRWGHLETFSEYKTFAFMVSLKTARGMRERLARGEKIMLHAVVKAGQHAGNYEVVTAVIPGADAKLKEEEIAFSCHLDHQRPGANDNASGCVTILEVARTLNKLISEGKLARPARTIRFIWPPEIEGTLALLNSVGRISEPVPGGELRKITPGPDLTRCIKVAIHMDMVGGGPVTKAVFHVTRGPMSLPSFVHDVAWAFADWLNDQSYRFAAGLRSEYPMVAPEGGKEPLRAEYSAYTMGSDHDVYQDSSFGIPAIYMNDWPDRYIHTNFDTAANIDTTKLKRAAFIGAASGYFLAGMDTHGGAEATGAIAEQASQRRLLDTLNRIPMVNRFVSIAGSATERGVLITQTSKYEDEIRPSVLRIVPQMRELQDYPWLDKPADKPTARTKPQTTATEGASQKFQRQSQPKGPLAVFGYDYFEDHAKLAGVATPKLFGYEGLWGEGEEYAYEVLNFADGKRNAQEIRDAVSAEYGPVPLEMVVEYLRALEKIGLVAEVK